MMWLVSAHLFLLPYLMVAGLVGAVTYRAMRDRL